MSRESKNTDKTGGMISSYVGYNVWGYLEDFLIGTIPRRDDCGLRNLTSYTITIRRHRPAGNDISWMACEHKGMSLPSFLFSCTVTYDSILSLVSCILSSHYPYLPGRYLWHMENVAVNNWPLRSTTLPQDIVSILSFFSQ